MRAKDLKSQTDFWWNSFLEMNVGRAVLSVVLGFLVGAFFIIGSNPEFLAALGYFFSRPSDALSAGLNAASSGFMGLFQGAFFNFEAESLQAGIKPITETFRFAGPLITAGLGLSIAFQSGLFNIGATGQIVMGMIGAVWVSTKLNFPIFIHQFAAIVAAIAFAALWGAIVGLLKARTGAHEVILTIMFNYIAIGIFAYVLRTPGLLKQPGESTNPKAASPADSAIFGPLFGQGLALHWGVILTVLALVCYWWLMRKSSFGFRLRAVGLNVHAARTAGIEPKRITIEAMALSAAFMGLVAANQVLGSTNGATTSSHVNIGFDAITVSLLGGSSPLGLVLAGLLFGAFKAGSPAMQLAGVSADVLTIVQASIVLFIAAPPLVKAIFRLRFRKTMQPYGVQENKVQESNNAG